MDLKRIEEIELQAKIQSMRALPLDVHFRCADDVEELCALARRALGQNAERQEFSTRKDEAAAPVVCETIPAARTGSVR